jgi:hypothetical protein
MKSKICAQTYREWNDSISAENHIERSESVPLDSEVLDWMRRVKAADNADELVRHIMEPLEAATPEPTERLIN